MIDPVTFSSSEAQQIKEKLTSPGFSAASWSDTDIENIKNTIKTHYKSEQAGICPYCQQNIRSNHSRHWDIEHIIARSHVANFMFEPVNLCLACVDCNAAKLDKKVTQRLPKKTCPHNSTAYLIVHPILDRYEEHILVIKPGEYYVAKSKKGEKTIYTCRLNRFYQFAGYSEEVGSEGIRLLAEQLENAKNPKTKQYFLNKIAALSIQALITNTETRDGAAGED